MASLFAVVPTRLVRDPSLSAAAKAVATVIASYASQDREAWPSRASIAEGAGCSVDTVDRAIVDLCGAGYLVKSARSRQDGGQTSNVYRLQYTDDALYTPAEGGPHQCGGGAAPVRRGGRTDAEGEPHGCGPISTIDQDTPSSSAPARKKTETPADQRPASDRITAALGEHAESWHRLALALRSGPSREAVAGSLLGALSGLGVQAPIVPECLAAGIDSALSIADRPSTRLILGCARREARGDAPQASTAGTHDDVWAPEKLWGGGRR